MKLKEWILEQLEKNDFDNLKVYELYDEYVKKSNSDFFEGNKKKLLKRNSYERLVRSCNNYTEKVNRKPADLPDDVDIKTEIVQDENGIKIIGSSRQIKTKEDLIKECKIDIDNYIEISHKANTWNSFYKSTETGEAKIVQLFQQELRLKPKVIEESQIGFIKPIQVDFEYKNPVKTKTDELQKVIIMADAQIGYLRNFQTNEMTPMQCEDSLNLALKICESEQPDKIILAGDMLDLTEASSYEQKKEFVETTQESINRLGKYLVNLREICPNSYIALQEGNHSKRLQKSINNNVSWASNLKPFGSDYEIFDLRFLLNLDKMGIEYFPNYPNNPIWLNDNLKVVHGNIARAGAGATSKAYLDSNMVSVISAHVHRMEILNKTYEDRFGVYDVTSCTIGCLCRNDGVVPSKNGGSENWQKGICKVLIHGEDFQIDNIAFKNNKAFIDNKVFFI